MNKTLRRIVFATLISASGFAATFTWYHFSASEFGENRQAKPIARLVTVTNEVQKKSVQRIIWQPANENEILNIGEAIRTAPNAEARIEFLNSTTAIDLEPDSAIVLEENDGDIALDFLKGHILVKTDESASADPGAKQITLKTGDKQIALGKSEVSLGRSTSGELDLQLLSGQLAGVDTHRSTQIQLKNYNSTLPFYLDPNTDEGFLLEWEPLPKGYQVHLEAGTTRDNLRPVPNATATGESGRLKAKTKIGRMFFRLVAKTVDTEMPVQQSAIIRATVLSKAPPTQLLPEKDANVVTQLNESNIKFLWSNPSGYKKIILEVAQSADLKVNKQRFDIDTENEWSFAPTKEGTYYWRVSGVLEGRQDVSASPIQKFNVKLLNEVQPPILLSPIHNEQLSDHTSKEKGIILKWSAAIGAQKYKVTINEQADNQLREPAAVKNIISEETQLLQYRVKDLKPGRYTWSVSSVDNKQKISKASAEQAFTIQSLPQIIWADGKTKEDYYYLSLRPSVELKWVKNEGPTYLWNVTLYKDESDTSPITKLARQPAIEVELPKDGRYFATIEALDNQSHVVARSIKREINLMPAPLLPPPLFVKNTPQELEATGSGLLSLEWIEVDGAKKYVLVLKNAAGETEKQLNFNTAQAQLQGLMPGEYKISLRSVDQNGRIGPESESRKLKVPNQSNLRAPKLKGVKFN